MDVSEYRKITELISKEILGQLEESDRLILERWRKEAPENERLYQRLTASGNFERYLWQKKKIKTDYYWKQLERKMGGRRSFLVWHYGRYAAAIAALIVIGWILIRPVESPQQQKQVTENTKSEILPGGAKAVLVLTDGSRVDLPEDKQAKMKVEGMEISNNQVKVKTSAATPKGWNKIITPRGGEYNLVLADGTIVYINSETQLDFPVEFENDRRVVCLKGEAYFQVAQKSGCPFIVKTERMDVRVTGTEFNLKAYADESSVQTTLVKGKVEVKAGKETYPLRPSQQAVLNKESARMTIKEVDVTPYIAWKNGQFIFKADRLDDIMRTLQRWYDCEVVYEEEYLKEIVFAGRLKRTETIVPILDVIRSTRKISVEVRGKQILFSKK